MGNYLSNAVFMNVRGGMIGFGILEEPRGQQSCATLRKSAEVCEGVKGEKSRRNGQTKAGARQFQI
jgi:hypothetical protein